MTLKHTLLAHGAFGGMTTNERRLGRFIRDGDGHPDPVPAPSATPAPPEGQDAFDAAFAEHAAETPTPAASAAQTGTEPPAQPVESPAPAPSDGAPPAGGETTKPASAPPAGDAGDAAPPAAPASADDLGAAPPASSETKPVAPSAEEIVRGLADMIRRGNTAPAAPAPEPSAAPTEQTPVYTPDELQVLQDYERNWPDVAQAELLRRRAEYHDILKFVFTEVSNLVAPLQEQQRLITNTLHVGELKAAVPDYSEDLETQVTAWVDTQPAYLQAAYKQVMQSGTSEEVADLIGRYRAATGTAPAAPAPAAPAAPAAAAPAAPVAAPKTELSSAAKQAAESLAPVSGERSAVPAGEETQDFDSAFAKYAAVGA